MKRVVFLPLVFTTTAYARTPEEIMCNPSSVAYPSR